MNDRPSKCIFYFIFTKHNSSNTAFFKLSICDREVNKSFGEPGASLAIRDGLIIDDLNYGGLNSQIAGTP